MSSGNLGHRHAFCRTRTNATAFWKMLLIASRTKVNVCVCAQWVRSSSCIANTLFIPSTFEAIHHFRMARSRCQPIWLHRKRWITWSIPLIGDNWPLSHGDSEQVSVTVHTINKSASVQWDRLRMTSEMNNYVNCMNRKWTKNSKEN